MCTLPAEVLRFTRRQLGLVTRAQLLVVAAGLRLTDAAVDEWVRRGYLERVHHGVSRLPGCPITDELRLLANVLRAGRGAVADGTATCALFGLEGFRLAKTSPLLPDLAPPCGVPAGRKPPRGGGGAEGAGRARGGRVARAGAGRGRERGAVGT